MKFVKLILLLNMFFSSAWAKPKTVSEVKALFLLNIIKYTEWPERTGEDFNLLIVGETPVHEVLKQFKGSHIGVKKIAVYYVNYDENVDLSDYDCVFISSSKPHLFTKFLETAHGQSTLTVSDSPWFIEAGGIVNFLIVDKRVRFQINMDSLKRTNLKISSKVLRLSYKK